MDELPNGLDVSKPSYLMDAMLALLGTHKPCFLFKQVFHQQLPDYVRTTLTNYREIVQEADQIYLLGRDHPANIIQEVNATGYKSRKACPPTISNLCCYYHRFGKSANKCLPHC